MSHITLDEPVLAKLRVLTEPVDVVDEQGELVGRYTPAPQPKRITPEEARRLFDLDKAKETLERERHLGRPLKDILADLEARDKRQ